MTAPEGPLKIMSKRYRPNFPHNTYSKSGRKTVSVATVRLLLLDLLSLSWLGSFRRAGRGLPRTITSTRIAHDLGDSSLGCVPEASRSMGPAPSSLRRHPDRGQGRDEMAARGMSWMVMTTRRLGTDAPERLRACSARPRMRRCATQHRRLLFPPGPAGPTSAVVPPAGG